MNQIEQTVGKYSKCRAVKAGEMSLELRGDISTTVEITNTLEEIPTRQLITAERCKAPVKVIMNKLYL